MDGPRRDRRLDPFALPSETTLRFALLILAVVGTTLVVYRELWRLSEVYDTVEYLCGPYLDRPTDLPVGVCMDAYERWTAVWMSAGLALLGIVAAALYVATPALKLAWDGLRPLGEQDAPGLPAHLAALTQRAGVDRPPGFVWNPLDAGGGAVVFGRAGKPIVALGGGLVARFFAGDRQGFDAIVLHELAHVRNRDLRATSAALAVWRAFALVALAPMLVGWVIPTLRDAPAIDDEGPQIVPVLVATAALTVLVFLMRNAVLRARELYADVRAAQHREVRGALRSLLGAQEGGSRRALLRVHPGAATRLRLLDDTRDLYRMGFWEPFGAGMAATLAIAGTGALVASLAGDADPVPLPPGAQAAATVAAAPLAAAVVVIGSWRARLAEALGSVLKLGIGLGAGLVAGVVLMVRGTTEEEAVLREGWPAVGGMLAILVALTTAAAARWWSKAARRGPPKRALRWAVAAGAAAFTAPLALFPFAPRVGVAVLVAFVALLVPLAAMAWVGRRAPLPSVLLLPEAEDAPAVESRPAAWQAAAASPRAAGAAVRRIPAPELAAAAGGGVLLATMRAPWYGDVSAHGAYGYTEYLLVGAGLLAIAVAAFRATAPRLMTARVALVRTATTSLAVSRLPCAAVAAIAFAAVAAIVLSPGPDPAVSVAERSEPGPGLYPGAGALAWIGAWSVAALRRASHVRGRTLGMAAREHGIAVGELVAAAGACALIALLFLDWSGRDPATAEGYMVGWLGIGPYVAPVSLAAGLALALVVPRGVGGRLLRPVAPALLAAVVGVAAVIMAATRETAGTPYAALYHMGRYLPLLLVFAVSLTVLRLAPAIRALGDVLLFAAAFVTFVLLVHPDDITWGYYYEVQYSAPAYLGLCAVVVIGLGAAIAAVERDVPRLVLARVERSRAGRSARRAERRRPRVAR